MTYYEKWSLVVTIIGIAVGIGVLIVYALQLKAMRASVVASESAANAAETSADVAQKSLVLLNRAWLDTDNWAGINIIEDPREKPCIRITFDVTNTSPTPARIDQIEVSHAIFRGGIASQPIRTIVKVQSMVTPKRSHPVAIVTEPFPPFRAEGMLVNVQGRITYRDIFGNTRHKRFARLCRIRPDRQDFMIPQSIDAQGVGWNDEEEWTQEQRNPN